MKSLSKILLSLFVFAIASQFVPGHVLAETVEPPQPPTTVQNTPPINPNQTNTPTGSTNTQPYQPKEIFNFDPKVRRSENSNIFDLIRNVIYVMLGIIASLAVVFIVIGGFRLVISQGNSENVSSAKKTIQWAVIGLIVTLLSFAILQAINSILKV